MSQDKLKELTAENEKLKVELSKVQTQLTQYQSSQKGLMAQFESAKQMFNEALNNSMILRTNVILLQNEIKELNEKLALANKKEINNAVN